MRTTIVRYKVKPDRVAEHEGLIRAVYAELATTRPPDLRYAAFKQADGVSFVHISFTSAPGNPLEQISAFRAFTANIRERCDEPPVAAQLEEVGNYGLC